MLPMPALSIRPQYSDRVVAVTPPHWIFCVHDTADVERLRAFRCFVLREVTP